MRGVVAMVLAAMALPLAGKMAATSAGVHVVAFDPSREPLRVHRAASAAGEEFSDVVARHRPRVAVNGTYYGTDGRPLGILRSNGRWIFRGGHMRTAFTVDRDGHASIRTRDEVRKSPSLYPFAVAAGPKLLAAGSVCLNPEAEGFHSASRRVRAGRTALGIRADGAALIIVDELPVTLAEFANVCREAGAVEAVNLDGGGATALYQDGRTVVSPRIPMADVITLGTR